MVAGASLTSEESNRDGIAKNAPASTTFHMGSLGTTGDPAFGCALCGVQFSDLKVSTQPAVCPTRIIYDSHQQYFWINAAAIKYSDV